MDLDFDGPSKVPTRQSCFAPKSSKLKPQPETKSKIETLPQSDSAISTKKEELSVHLAENGAVTGNDDVPLQGETTGNDLGDDEEQVTDSDHDEVVREIDVCINPSFDLSTQLYVFQYPLRAVWRPYELEERCQEVRLRRSTAEMEVDLAIDLDSKFFDRDSVHAATIKKQMLSTSWMPLPTCASGYAVGVLIGDKETSEWTVPPLIRDSFSMIGSAVGGTASAFYGFNHVMPIVRRWVKGPMWLHFLVGAPPVIVFSSACAGMAGGAVPAFTQLASSYHAAISSSTLPPTASQDENMRKSRTSSTL